MSKIGFNQGIEQYAYRSSFPQGWDLNSINTSPDGSIRYIDVYSPHRRSFVKELANHNIPQGEHEIANNAYFETEQGWLSPMLLHYVRGQDRTIIAYEFIDGQTLFDSILLKRRRGQQIHTDDIRESVRQIGNLSYNLDEKTATQLYTTPLKRPTTVDLFVGIPSIVNVQDLNQAWDRFTGIIDGVSAIIPGYYFDRNPRNIIKSESGIYQVDSEIITPATPLLDLSILLRTGYDARTEDSTISRNTFFDNVDERKRALGILGSFSSDIEQAALAQFRNIHANQTTPGMDDLDLLMNLVNAYTHIHFLQFPLSGKVNDPQNYKCKLRHCYHGLAAYESFDRIKDQDVLGKISNMIPSMTLTLDDITVLQKTVREITQYLAI